MLRRMPRALLCLFVLFLGACATSTAPPPAHEVVQTTWDARFSSACVAADQPLASRAGALMLARGGNAVDAAVAAAFTLSVVRPYSCGIGGGGFMVIRLAPSAAHPQGLDVAINYRETTPAGVDPLFYERHPDPDASTRGGSAVAVPGSVAGLLEALRRFGSLDRAIVLQPAIDAAEQGFVLDDHYVGAARAAIAKFRERPEYQVRFAFVWDRFLARGEIRAGDVIRNPEQARAIRLIARDGADAFYRGPIAHAIARAVQDDHAPLRLADLAAYRTAPATPIRVEAFDRCFLLMPPPSSGGVAMGEILGVLGRVRFATSDESLRPHLLAESMKHAFADRAAYLADPAFTPVPFARLLSAPALDALASRVDPARTLGDPSRYGTGASSITLPEDAGTSHISVVDALGNAVACTETINLEFGSLLAVPEYGFCLNNEMDDFTTRRQKPNAFGLVQSDRNLPQPGKRPLSSMSPTIVLDADGRVVAVAGASGGPRIISATTQVLLNTLVLGQDAGSAVDSPRFHHQWRPPELEYEAALESREELLRSLSARGHSMKKATSAANVQLIVREADGGWRAACDPRKGGRPAGY
jgi:gamma-glutamyltranspeptidase/glutathione hydrolase